MAPRVVRSPSNRFGPEEETQTRFEDLPFRRSSTVFTVKGLGLEGRGQEHGGGRSGSSRKGAGSTGEHKGTHPVGGQGVGGFGCKSAW